MYFYFVILNEMNTCYFLFSFHPKDHDVICIVGKNVLKFCRLVEGILKPFGFTKGDSIVCIDHAWLLARYSKNDFLSYIGAQNDLFGFFGVKADEIFISSVD